ncbi:hypothetical protein BABINDRAFT_130761 [Babjeviella inositovora NRRL Y-12698]|uniref:Uncharacterized protein n=1 Tax=Babjeviella inositovora NRRL Y-12698 TaxID=984486 RepID=A0A1E3QT89_9ASCO|nr:uncharacterized protein BABINDRAFT_130761 [Babjeviella inositovora NRRL Y-12698]ODQ80232.1 hypothetical protein BABINDRAFT_130761 [Babjeviella inositovora NRRL Y-12698]
MTSYPGQDLHLVSPFLHTFYMYYKPRFITFDTQLDEALREQKICRVLRRSVLCKALTKKKVYGTRLV